MTSFVPNDGSDYMLRVLFGRFEVPLAQYWLGLTNEVPEIGDTGTDLSEPDDPSYGRISIDNYPRNWEEVGYGEIDNAQDLIFPAVALDGDWGLLKAAVLLDTEKRSTGRLLMIGVLAPPVRPDPGISVRIPSGGLTLSLTSVTPSFQPT